MHKSERIVFQTLTALLIGATLTTCSESTAPSDGSGTGGTVAGSGGNVTTKNTGGAGGTGPTSIVGGSRGQCKPSAAGLIRITGTLCGASIDYQGPAETNVDLTRASFTQDSSKVFVIQATEDKSGEAPILPRFFGKNDLYLNLSFDEGLVPSVGSGSYRLKQGVLFACGLGSFAAADGSNVSVDIEQIGPPRTAGQLKMKIRDLVPKGFTTEYGQLEFDACSKGSLTIEIDAPYVHEPG